MARPGCDGGRGDERHRFLFARVRCGSCRAEFLVAFSCKGRGLCPSCAAKRAGELTAAPVPEKAPAALDLIALRHRRAQLIRRIYEVAPLSCRRCGAVMRIVAFITEPRAISKILRHLATRGADQRGPPRGGTAAA